MDLVDPYLIHQAVSVLRSGGVVAHPTDTCYGLAADIHNPSALNRLYDLKGMDLHKPVSILVPSLAVAERYGRFTPLAHRLARDYWPGALTLIVERTQDLPDFFNPGQDSIGIRFIDEPISNALVQTFGDAVTTTSANVHGRSSAYRIEDIGLEVDFYLDGGVLNSENKPSTLVDARGETLKIVRQGSLTINIQ